jgi:hypothetical protein
MNSSSNVFDMGPHGLMQVGCMPNSSMAMLHRHSAVTPPDASAYAHDLFDSPTINVLHQAHLNETPLRCIKLANGFVIVTPTDKIVSVISDKRLCPSAEPSVHITPEDTPSYFISHVQDPSAPPVKPMFLVHHSRVTQSHEISRYSPVCTFASKFTAHIPLERVPRVMMASHTMGKAEARVLCGAEADMMKSAVLAAASQGELFRRPVSVSETLGNALMINNSTSPVFCMRIKDGLVGYRERNDGKHSFVFVAHSADVNHDKPIPGSPVKVVKVTYNSDAISAPRLMVCHNEADRSHTDDAIHSGMSVEDVMNRLSDRFDKTNVHGMGCQNYETLCAAAADDPSVWTCHAATNIMASRI